MQTSNGKNWGEGVPYKASACVFIGLKLSLSVSTLFPVQNAWKQKWHSFKPTRNRAFFISFSGM